MTGQTACGIRSSFEDPIPLPYGRVLITLCDAGDHIASLPKNETGFPESQTAIEALMLVVEESGPTMFARIGVMRALNRGHVRDFNPDGKDHHWGRRMLTRDLWIATGRSIQESRRPPRNSAGFRLFLRSVSENRAIVRIVDSRPV
jgi:hypothetical protein